MKEWKAPKLSNLNVSQTMNTEELSDPRAYSWKCECDGCGYTSIYYPDSTTEPTLDDIKREHMSDKHPNGCLIS